MQTSFTFTENEHGKRRHHVKFNQMFQYIHYEIVRIHTFTCVLNLMMLFFHLHIINILRWCLAFFRLFVRFNELDKFAWIFFIHLKNEKKIVQILISPFSFASKCNFKCMKIEEIIEVSRTSWCTHKYIQNCNSIHTRMSMCMCS